jgi:hypothetical protein
MGPIAMELSLELRCLDFSGAKGVVAIDFLFSELEESPCTSGLDATKFGARPRARDVAALDGILRTPLTMELLSIITLTKLTEYDDLIFLNITNFLINVDSHGDTYTFISF